MAALRTAQRRSIVGSSDARLESVHAHDGSLIGRRTHPLEMEAVEDECEMIAAASVGDGGLSICTHLPSAHGSAASTMSRPSMGADGQDGEGMLSSWAGDSVVEDMYVHHSCSSSRPSSVKRVNSTKIETSPTSLHRRRGSNHALASTTTNNNNNSSNPSMLVMANNSTSTAPKTNSLHSRGTDAEHHGSGARVHRLSGNRNSSSRPPLGPTKVVAGGSSSSTTLHGRNNATTYVESLSADTAMANILLPSSTSHSSIGSLPSKTSSALPPPLATVSVGVLRSNLSLISPFSRRPRAGSASTSSAAAVEEAEDLLTATVSMVDDTTLGDAVHHHHHPPHHHHAQQHPLSGALRRRELRTGSDASVDDMAPLALPPSPVSSTSRHFNGSLTAAGREDGDPLMLLLHHEEDEVDVEDEGGSTTIGRSQQHTRSPAHVYGMSFGASAEDLVGEVLIAVDDGELMPPSPSSAAVVADDVQGCSIVHELPGLIPAAISTTTYVSHQPTLANNNNNTSARHARAEVRRMDGGSNNAV